MTIDRDTAANVFIASFAHLQRRTHQSVLERVNDVPFVRFGAPAEGRSEEFFALCGAEPSHVHTIARLHARTPGYWITAIDPLEVSSAEQYRALGYDLEDQEWLMALPLTAGKLPPESPAQIVDDPDIVAQINAASGRPVFPIHALDQPDLTIVAVFAGGELAAWGGQIWADWRYPYVTHIRTTESHRRRGLATAVMNTLLREAHARRAVASVLAATVEGRLLYQRLGYQDLAHVRIWRSPSPIMPESATSADHNHKRGPS